MSSAATLAPTPAAEAAAGAMMSAYELARLQRIRENKAVMASLGLAQAKKHLADAANVNRRTTLSSSSSSNSSTTSSSTSRGSRKRKADKAPVGPTRRSSRLKGGPSQHVALTGKQGDEEVEYFSDEDADDGRTAEEIAALEEQRQAQRTKLYKELLGRHNHNGLKLPPSATYEHTVMRVETMSEKKLQTRIKVIERAQGQYAILKMRMFAEVLVLEGHEVLAKEAEQALARLLALDKFKNAARELRLLYKRLKDGRKK
jgi:hypothetical protein